MAVAGQILDKDGWDTTAQPKKTVRNIMNLSKHDSLWLWWNILPINLSFFYVNVIVFWKVGKSWKTEIVYFQFAKGVLFVMYSPLIHLPKGPGDGKAIQTVTESQAPRTVASCWPARAMQTSLCQLEQPHSTMPFPWRWLGWLSWQRRTSQTPSLNWNALTPVQLPLASTYDPHNKPISRQSVRPRFLKQQPQSSVHAFCHQEFRG